MNNIPRLAIVIPCYNEALVLPQMVPRFVDQLKKMEMSGLVSHGSYVLLVNDGSSDETWDAIRGASSKNPCVRGISLSRNRGHQNALLGGLMEVREDVDAAISADCDGQDDISAMDDMVRDYLEGSDVVYACRDSRETDTWFKRTTAEFFYRLIRWMGGEVVFNHADYRLASSRVLRALAEFREVNLFLRGMFPLVGFRSSRIYYSRKERVAGKSHYPFLKMLGFGIDGITSLSIKPIRMITAFGALVSLYSFCIMAWALISYFAGCVVPGWASSTISVCFLGGIQLVSLGVIGEYVGKIYLETKRRPRFIISERCGYPGEKDDKGGLS